jgi:hypothetical protein
MESLVSRGMAKFRNHTYFESAGRVVRFNNVRFRRPEYCYSLLANTTVIGNIYSAETRRTVTETSVVPQIAL